MKHDLSGKRYIDWWADSIYTAVRAKDSASCLLVITCLSLCDGRQVGVTPEAKKERVTLGEGFRESKASWLELLCDLRARGLESGPLLAVGDGAPGFWAALDEVYPATRPQRCWVYKSANVLNALPRWLQAKAKAQLHEIWMAPTRAKAIAAFNAFLKTYGAKYPKATKKLERDRDVLPAFYDFPAEHRVHLRDLPDRIDLRYGASPHHADEKLCVTHNFPGAGLQVGKASR